MPGGWGGSGDGERFLNNILQEKKTWEDSDSFSFLLLHDFPWANVSFILVFLPAPPFFF